MPFRQAQKRNKVSQEVLCQAFFQESGLADGAQIEQGQGTGAGMGADDRANIIDVNILGAKALPDHVSHQLRILEAVAVADKDGFLALLPECLLG